MIPEFKVTKVTPTKITIRSPVCRICGVSRESRHVVRIFGKAWSTKDMCLKLRKTCGVNISEDDEGSKVICRQCVAFVNKMNEFINKAQSMQERPLCDKLSVKRCIEHSPSQHLSKRLQQRNCAMTGSAAKQLFGATEPMSGREDEETNTKPREETVQQPILLPKAISEAECAYIQPLLTERQKEMIIQALSSGDAVVLAAILKKHCASVINEIQKLLCDDVRKSCEKLCKRSGGSSVLYGKDYESLSDFNFNKVWDELKANQPFFVELMNAMSGNNIDIEDTKHELRVKYSFLYSILMNERWHELSLIKRMITILIIEGGCSKNVRCKL